MIDVPVEVKDALREGTYKKNYRFVVLNEDGTPDETIGTIDNDYLVSESVSIDERMCSGDTLKFGLCEGSSLEFQYFDKPNITGKRVQAFVDVHYGYSLGWQDYYQFPGTGELRKTIDKTCVFRLRLENEHTGMFINWTNGGVASGLYASPSWGFDYYNFGEMYPGDYVELIPEDFIAAYTAKIQSHDKLNERWYTIPMGFFDVKKCSRQASTGIIKATCYNKLQSEYLDENAIDTIKGVFGDRDVYLTDMIRVLLEGYRIEKLEESYVDSMYLDYDTVHADAKNTFSPFKYTTLYGDQGPFSPTIYAQSSYITTNSNIYLGGVAKTSYFFDDRLRTYPVRIEVDSIIEQLDINIANFIQESLNKISANTTGATLWNRLRNMSGRSGIAPNLYLKGYFFSVWVSFWDSRPDEIYGNQVLNATGTFDDLRNTTFINVRNIAVCVPRGITFGYSCSSIDGSIDKTISGPDYGSSISCVGENRHYLYRIQGESSAREGVYVTPKMPNGEDIPARIDELYFKVKVITEGVSGADLIQINPTQIENVTLRELQSADFETKCQFGQLSRITDLFSGVELNHSRLYPADTLYPATDLYPDGAALSGFKSMYSKLWADEGNVHKWRYLIITYKALDGEGNEVDRTLQRTINADGTDNYNMSDNWLFRNLVWTAEEVGTYADAMVLKMQDVTWFPFEMWCAGLPYLETGDEIEIPLGEHSYTSYVLQRQLKGIQNLQDTYINGTLDIF